MKKEIMIGGGILLLAVVGGWLFFSGEKEEQKRSIEPTQAIEKDIQEITRIYALGDSLTAGYQLPLEDSYPAQLEHLLQEQGYMYTVINAGKSGDTSDGLLARLEWIMTDSEAGDIALLVIGANDGMQSLPLDQLENNIQETIEILQAKDIQVVLGGMQLPTNLDPLYRASFKDIYASIAGAYDIPLIPFFLEGVAADPRLNLRDGIHPNQQGYSIIANNVAKFLKEAGVVTK